MPPHDPIDPLYDLLEEANPNPDRVGCLTDDQILAFAQGTQPVTDPGFAHVTACFPCYRKFGVFRTEIKRSSLRRRAVVAAAVTLLVASGVLFLFLQPREVPRLVAPDTTPRPAPTVQAKAALID